MTLSTQANELGIEQIQSNIRTLEYDLSEGLTHSLRYGTLRILTDEQRAYVLPAYTVSVGASKGMPNPDPFLIASMEIKPTLSIGEYEKLRDHVFTTFDRRRVAFFAQKRLCREYIKLAALNPAVADIAALSACASRHKLHRG